MKIVENEKLIGARILVAEDDRIGALILERLFDLWGVVCEVAKSGEEAIEIISGKDFDMVLMDVQMPGISGVEATIQIRTGKATRNKEVPIIGLSAHSSKSEAEKCLNAGMNDYICKPFEPALLHSKILSYLEK